MRPHTRCWGRCCNSDLKAMQSQSLDSGWVRPDVWGQARPTFYPQDWSQKFEVVAEAECNATRLRLKLNCWQLLALRPTEAKTLASPSGKAKMIVLMPTYWPWGQVRPKCWPWSYDRGQDWGQCYEAKAKMSSGPLWPWGHSISVV